MSNTKSKTTKSNKKTNKFKRTLTIKMSEWLRQTPKTKTASLLRRDSDGKKCCLGFECKSLGLLGITGIADPATLVNDIKNKEKQLEVVKKLSFLLNKNRSNIRRDWLDYSSEVIGKRYHNSKDCQNLMEVNDNSLLSDDEKMQKIKSIFAKHKVRVVFVP